MATPNDDLYISAHLHCIVREAPKVQPRRYKKALFRHRGRVARWTHQSSTAASSRLDGLQFQRWVRATAASTQSDTPSDSRFARYDVKTEVPTYDEEIYEKHLTHNEWTKEETDYLVDVYRECGGKWPVIIDHYSYGDPENRSMEDLKARFYTVSAVMLQLNTPITSMTAPEYTLYETLSNFNPGQEISRKKLAEGHLQRRQAEVDEESVLLSELQRIMLNQANVDSERDVSRSHRCDRWLLLTSFIGLATSIRLPTSQHQWLSILYFSSTHRLVAAIISRRSYEEESTTPRDW